GGRSHAATARTRVAAHRTRMTSPSKVPGRAFVTGAGFGRRRRCHAVCGPSTARSRFADDARPVRDRHGLDMYEELTIELPSGPTRVVLSGEGAPLMWTHGLFHPTDVEDRTVFGRVLASLRGQRIVRFD